MLFMEYIYRCAGQLSGQLSEHVNGQVGEYHDKVGNVL